MTETRKTIYVIGHKNPDTDSICSAIALANLKNQLAERGEPLALSASYSDGLPENVRFLPVRAGHLSGETSYVLDRFGFEKPIYMKDARTQVKDIDYSRSPSVDGEISLLAAWRIMRDVKKSTLAVTDADGEICGVITTSDIAKSYMAVFDNEILAKAKTPYRNILETLEGTLVAGDPAGVVTAGRVLIGAGNTESIRAWTKPGDVVILGNRYEAQLCAIEQQASVIICCEGAAVSRTITKIAAESGCAVISTPYDTYAVARMINQSLPIRHFMTKAAISFAESSYIDDIRGPMTKERYRDFPITGKDGNYLGMISRRNLIDMDSKQFILVDHNEPGQAIDGIQEAEVLEIVDHHKLGTIETVKPVIMRNRPVGCTATIVTQMYEENDIEITPEIAGILCSAIISDTLLFRSPTCTSVDEETANRLAQIAGIDPEAHAVAMFDAGSDFASKSEEDIFYQDFKKFKAGDLSFGIGQISSMNESELVALRDRIRPFLEEARAREGADMVFFLLTDILTENSWMICCGDQARESAEAAFGPADEDGNFLLKGLVSRKKQFVPAMMEQLTA